MIEYINGINGIRVNIGAINKAKRVLLEAQEFKTANRRNNKANVREKMYIIDDEEDRIVDMIKIVAQLTQLIEQSTRKIQSTLVGEQDE